MTAPEFIVLDLGMFFEEQSGTAAFECLDDVCRRILWLEADEHVHMLWHNFQLFDSHIVQLRDAQQDILHLLHELRCREGWVPILRHPNQMNVEKQRLLIARLTAQVMQRRRDFLHRTSATLIKNHDLVAAEELRSRNLLKNHALAMSIQDNGWRMFLSMLTYKVALYGKNFVTVDPRNTTQTCHACGHIMSGKEKLTLKDREWICPKCGIHHIRDVNAAKNILARAKAKFVSMH